MFKCASDQVYCQSLWVTSVWLAQQRMTSSDREWPFYASRAVSAVVDLLVCVQCASNQVYYQSLWVTSVWRLVNSTSSTVIHITGSVRLCWPVQLQSSGRVDCFEKVLGIHCYDVRSLQHLAPVLGVQQRFTVLECQLHCLHQWRHVWRQHPLCHLYLQIRDHRYRRQTYHCLDNTRLSKDYGQSCHCVCVGDEDHCCY